MDNREIDKLIAEKVMGENLKPHKDLAKVAIGRKYIAMTGPVFHLTTGEMLRIPRHIDELRVPVGSTDLNDRYCLYVAEYLGERIADEVDAYRLNAKTYSSNPQVVWLVIKAMEEKLFITDLSIWRNENECVFTALDYQVKYEAAASTIEMAICLAALKSAGVEVESNWQ